VKTGGHADVSRETISGGHLEAVEAGRLSAAHLGTLRTIAGSVGRPLPSRFQSSCDLFLAELEKWNRRINLISVKDRARIVERHVLDSLCLLAYESRLGGKLVLDVGPGAGFPGMVLAMWEDGAKFTLVESKSKAVAFLRAVRRGLNLANVDVVHARLESATRAGRIPPVDLVTSRAVGGTLRLAEHAAPLLNPGGAIVVYAAKNPRTTILAPGDARALKQLGLGVEHVTPSWQSLTTLLVLRKLR
jgi:16S rRNA (guanine527-N7)-methyltransferase